MRSDVTNPDTKTQEKPLTRGEYIVRIKFNPGNDEGVFDIKTQFANLINAIDRTPVKPAYTTEEVHEFIKLKEEAINSLEIACMQAVKAFTIGFPIK